MLILHVAAIALLWIASWAHSRRVASGAEWDAMAAEMEALEEIELQVWEPDPTVEFAVPCLRTRRIEIMKRLAMTIVVLSALVIWHMAFGGTAARGDVTQPTDVVASDVAVDALTSAAPAVDGEEFVTIGILGDGSPGEMVGIDDPPAAAVAPDDLEETPLELSLGNPAEPTPPHEAVTEPNDGGVTVTAKEVPGDGVIPDPDSDAEVKEVLEGANFLVQAIKDKDATAITFGVFLLLFALFRLPPVRKTLGQWIPVNWYRAIPVVLAVVIGILTPILAGGEVWSAVIKGLLSGGGIVLIYAALVKATAKKTEAPK